MLEIEELADDDLRGLAKETRQALKAIAESFENGKTGTDRLGSCCGGIVRVDHLAVDRGQTLKSTELVPVFGSALIIALMPKCPLCWAAYLSFFGISTTQVFLSQRFVLGLAFCFLSVFVAVVGRRCWLAKSTLPFIVSVTGAIGLLVAMPLELHWSVRALSMSSLLLGSFLSAKIGNKKMRLSTP